MRLTFQTFRRRTARVFVLALLVVGPTVARSAPLLVASEKSQIEVAVRTTIHSFQARLSDYQLTVEGEREQLPRAAELVFDFKDLRTGMKRRDEDMLKWLDYPAFPKVSFHLTGWKRDGQGVIAVGDLLIHGVRKEIEIATNVKWVGGDFDFTGSVVIDCRDFKLPPLRKAFIFSLNPQLTVSLHIVGRMA